MPKHDTKFHGSLFSIKFLRPILSAILCIALLASPTLVLAQEAEQKPRTLFEILFGKKDKAPAQVKTDKKQPRKKKTVPADGVATGNPDTPVALAKLPDARKVLVIGDFLANGLADGLTTAFESAPAIVVETQTNAASGLVRKDYYDWETTLPATLDAVKPVLLVVMLGSNDRQQMRIGDTKAKFLSPEWNSEYQTRVDAIFQIAKSRNVNVLWVGLPSFGSPAMTADAITLNGIFRTATEKLSGEFVDVWDGFVDEAGKFIVTGSDINGQQVRLRPADGIGLTKAGKRKIAFYAEKPARKLLGSAADPVSNIIGAGSLPALLTLPPIKNERVVRMPPVALSDPEMDGASQLLGAAPTPTTVTLSPRDMLILNGKTQDAPAGRIDDFRLPVGKIQK
jgi:uncharacterized protein